MALCLRVVNQFVYIHTLMKLLLPQIASGLKRRDLRTSKYVCIRYLTWFPAHGSGQLSLISVNGLENCYNAEVFLRRCRILANIQHLELYLLSELNRVEILKRAHKKAENDRKSIQPQIKTKSMLVCYATHSQRSVKRDTVWTVKYVQRGQFKCGQ